MRKLVLSTLFAGKVGKLRCVLGLLNSAQWSAQKNVMHCRTFAISDSLHETSQSDFKACVMSVMSMSWKGLSFQALSWGPTMDFCTNQVGDQHRESRAWFISSWCQAHKMVIQPFSMNRIMVLYSDKAIVIVLRCSERDLLFLFKIQKWFLIGQGLRNFCGILWKLLAS